jgi:hypothetical protein
VPANVDSSRRRINHTHARLAFDGVACGGAAIRALGAIHERQEHMGPIARNSIAVISGVVVGSLVNMGLIMVSGQIIPPPEGVDVSTMEGLRSSMHLFEPKHFLFPFLAHALGAFVGSFVASMLAATQKMKLALGVSVFFLLGGIVNVFLLPSPIWFSALDLIVAYLPMGWLGGKLGESLRPTSSPAKLSAH